MTSGGCTHGVLVRAACSVLFSVGCVPDAERACVGLESGFEASELPTLEVEALQGELALASQGEEAALGLRFEVDGLPELWPAHDAISPRLRVSASVRYPDEPTAQSQSERPRIRLRLGTGAATVESTSEPFASGVGAEVGLLGCRDREVGCCHPGSTHCSVDVDAVLRRIEGEPFPPVVVDWVAVVQSQFDPCPFDAPTPSVRFSLIGGDM